MRQPLVVLTLLVAGSTAYATTWTGVPLTDQACSRKVASNPDAHTKSCALQCAKSGYGILDSKGNFLKFDKAGNDQALQLLKSTQANDHLRVNVEGEEKDGVLQVKSLKMVQ